MLNLLLENIAIYSPLDKLKGKRLSILIVKGKIEKIFEPGTIFWDNVEVIDCSDIIGIPGVFDMHVHFRQPGQTYKEDMFSGSLAAANGGVTGVLCMPNTNPPIDNSTLLCDLNKLSEELPIETHFSACVTVGRKGVELVNFNELISSGTIAFTDDGSPVFNSRLFKTALGELSKYDLPFLQHCEDIYLFNSGVMNEGEVSRRLGYKGIPEDSESVCIARDLEILKSVPSAKYHIQHISSYRSIELVTRAKNDNLPVTTEVCPHHFILIDENVETYGTNAKMNPPLRTKQSVESILQAIKNDVIDIIATDHAPHSEIEKALPFAEAPFGIIGLETFIGLCYTYLVEKGIISLEKLIEKISINPRRLLNLTDIRIREGEFANLTLIKTNQTWRVEKNKFKSKSRNTPFDGFELKCKPIGVISRNQIFYSEL
ncbi:MAG: dihydroorotase [Ignavibacteria bacterium]